MNATLLDAAEAQEARPKRQKHGVSQKYPDMIQAIVVLRAKNFTWRDIAEWFKERGVKYSPASIATAYSRAKKQGKI